MLSNPHLVVFCSLFVRFRHADGVVDFDPACGRSLTDLAAQWGGIMVRPNGRLMIGPRSHEERL